MIRMALFLVSVLFAAIPQQPPKRFDLKGETIGETLETFKSLHPSARCSKIEPERKAQLGEEGCMVYKGISFAGLPALSDADCDQIESKVGDGHNCVEGLSASFRNGKLIQLTYVVNAEGGGEWAVSQVISALS
jgi:hypothetical protein